MADEPKKRGTYYGKSIEDMTREELMDAVEHMGLSLIKAHGDAKRALDSISLLRVREYD